MDLLLSPYLEAIQAVPGSAPGDKYRKLNLVSKGIAETLKPPDDSPEIPVPADLNIPQPLVSLVQLQSADLMRQHNVIAKCITTEDNILIRKALKMHWFFRGENKKIINTAYFEKYLLPYLSLQTRGQVIKRLAMNLKTSGEEKTAEEFYTFLAGSYGRKQAEPLLVACSASFIYDTIIANKIVLSCRTVRILFVKHPELVVSYMKLSKADCKESSRYCYDINIRQYSNFLPRLIKNHLSDFIELLETHNSSLGVKLSNKATETFLKSNVDALLNNPKLYVELMPFKIIAAKLTKQQYKVMLLKLFPERVQQFSEKSIGRYLDYYPEQERMALAIDSYKEVYNANLLDNTEAIDVYFMCLLPADERARQARIKLAQNPDWSSNRYDIRKVWRCYLPIEESIPAIKTDIAKSSAAEDRSSLLCQIFYTCLVHDDTEALLEAMQYFTTRHKNEQSFVIFEVLDNIADFIDLSAVGKDHWAVLNDFIQFLRMTDQLKERPLVSKRILVSGIHFNLIHNLPIEDKIEMILDLNMKTMAQTWSLLEKYPEYDRRCFEAFLSMIPKKYPNNHEIWEDQRTARVHNILASIYAFNTRNAKVNSKIEKLSIKNYPWLLEAAKTIVESRESTSRDWKIHNLMSMLKIHDNDLYNAWTKINSQAVVSVESGDALARLAKDPKNILDNWEEYLKKARKCILHSSYAKRFIKATRWHQGIPIKFTTQCISDAVTYGDPSSIMVLGMLVEGEVFARIVESVTPKDLCLNPEDENAKAKYKLISCIPSAINHVEPPVPLEFVLNYCQSDFLKLGLIALTNVCRRTALDKVKNLAKTLVHCRVSVKKHGIRLFCLVGTIDNRRLFLSGLWNTENHISIRAVVFQRIYDLFINDPSPKTWSLMKNCIAELKIDDESSLKDLMKLSLVPDRYIADYIQQLLDTLEKLVADGYNATRASQYGSLILRSINGPMNNLMPEHFCEQLIRKYFCNPRLVRPGDLNVSSAGIDYVVHVYLQSADDKLSSRLAIICQIFEDVLKKHWNVPHPKIASFFPINYLAHNFVTSLMYLEVKDDNVRSLVMETVLKSFLNVLKPQCDYVAYALLSYGVVLRRNQTSAEIIAKIGETLPRFVEALSLEMVVFLAGVVKTWIQKLFAGDEVNAVIYALIESLCKIGTDSACLLAAKLLYLTETQEFESRRIKIFEFLRQSKCSAVVSLVYQHVNTRNLSNLQE